MRKIEFDELQQGRRYQYGYQSFILLASLLMIDNVLYSLGIIWENHPVNTFILLLTSFAYFISRCIWGDAMVGPKETPVQIKTSVAVVAVVAAIAAILTVGFVSFNLKMKPSDGGNDSLLFPYCIVMWLVIGIVYLMKRIKTKKTD